MTRVALIGSDEPLALESFYRSELEQQGHEVKVFNPERSVPRAFQGRVAGRLTWSLWPRLSGRALVRFFTRDPRWDAVVVFKGLFLPARALARCRALTSGARWGNLNPDNPFDLGRVTSSRHVREAIPLFDHYFIWSRDLLSPLRAAGARAVSYLPFGYARGYHHPSAQPDPELSRCVSFVGTFDPARARALEALADLPLRIYGGHWQRLPRSSKLQRCVAGDVAQGELLRRIVSSSLASINVMRAQNYGAHNMRTFEVPAMRGLLLTTRSIEQHTFLPEGNASLMFDSPAELRARVQELLHGKHDVEAMRARGFALVQSHSYAERARQLIGSLIG